MKRKAPWREPRIPIAILELVRGPAAIPHLQPQDGDPAALVLDLSPHTALRDGWGGGPAVEEDQSAGIEAQMSQVGRELLETLRERIGTAIPPDLQLGRPNLKAAGMRPRISAMRFLARAAERSTWQGTSSAKPTWKPRTPRTTLYRAQHDPEPLSKSLSPLSPSRDLPEKALVAKDLDIALAGQRAIDQGTKLLLVQLHLLTDQVRNLTRDLARASRPPRRDDSPAIHEQIGPSVYTPILHRHPHLPPGSVQDLGADRHRRITNACEGGNRGPARHPEGLGRERRGHCPG